MTPAGDPAQRPRWLLILLALLVAASLVGIGGAAAVITGLGVPATPTTDSVDAGFARDMSTHHRQAVTMAGIVRDRTSDPAIELLAYDIETSQDNQIGIMSGWLAVWGLPVNGAAEEMAWMGGTGSMLGADGRMPGMATTAEIDQLRTQTGTTLDVTFLQLMIRHHQGALPMARYAVDHAQSRVAAQLAGKIEQAQSGEIRSMTELLTARGGSPLPSG